MTDKSSNILFSPEIEHSQPFKFKSKTMKLLPVLILTYVHFGSIQVKSISTNILQNKNATDNFVSIQSLSNKPLCTFIFASPLKFDSDIDYLKNVLASNKYHKEWLNAVVNEAKLNKEIAKMLSFEYSKITENDLKEFLDKFQNKNCDLYRQVEKYHRLAVETNKNLTEVVQVYLFDLFSTSPFILNLPNLMENSSPTKQTVLDCEDHLKKFLTMANEDNRENIANLTNEYKMHLLEQLKQTKKATASLKSAVQAQKGSIDEFQMLIECFEKAIKTFEQLKSTLVEWSNNQETYIKTVQRAINQQ